MARNGYIAGLLLASLGFVFWMRARLGTHTDFFLIELMILLACWGIVLSVIRRFKSWLFAFLLGATVLPLQVAIGWPLAEDLTALKRIRFGRYSEDLGPRFFHSETTMPGDGFSSWMLDLRGGFLVAAIWIPLCLVLLVLPLLAHKTRSEQGSDGKPDTVVS